MDEFVSDALGPRNFEALKGLGLNPSIQSIEDYEERVLKGLKCALRVLKESASVLPSADILRAMHLCTFREVFSFAGELRREECKEDVYGFKGSTPSKIISDLKELDDGVERLVRKGGAYQKSKAIAFYHLGFHAVRPFREGDGLISRAIMQVQIEKLLKVGNEYHLSREEYMHAIREAQFTKFDNLIDCIMDRRLSMAREKEHLDRGALVVMKRKFSI